MKRYRTTEPNSSNPPRKCPSDNEVEENGSYPFEISEMFAVQVQKHMENSTKAIK